MTAQNGKMSEKQTITRNYSSFASGKDRQQGVNQEKFKNNTWCQLESEGDDRS